MKRGVRALERLVELEEKRQRMEFPNFVPGKRAKMTHISVPKAADWNENWHKNHPQPEDFA